MPWVWITLGVIAAAVLYTIVTYNRLVSSRERVRAAWAGIDTLLKRRHDLIPNLVETARGYAQHERATLESVIAARNTAAAARSPEESVAAENRLGGAVRQLLAVAEAYPQLKADAAFVRLQGELSDTENQIASARAGYNASTQEFNTSIQAFPTNLLAGAFGFRVQPFFEVQDPAQRDAPVVKF
jgi:LemA protein